MKENTPPSNPHESASNDNFHLVGKSGFIEYPTLNQLVKAILRSPTDGIALALQPRPPRKLTLELKLFALTLGIIFIATLFAIFFLNPASWEELDAEYLGIALFIAAYFGIMGVLFQLAISLFVFLFKVVYGKARFKEQLLVGALCGLPFCGFILCAGIFACFDDGFIFLALAFSLSLSLPMFLLGTSLLFSMLFMVEIVRQSLLLGGLTKTASWYWAPIVVAGSGYTIAKLIDLLKSIG